MAVQDDCSCVGRLKESLLFMVKYGFLLKLWNFIYDQ